MKELTCIVCPRGCRLVVGDDNSVSGNLCPRGAKYAIKELTAPERSLTTSVRIKNRDFTLVSVRTTGPIPKNKIMEAMNEINKISLIAPVKIGDVALSNLLGTGVDVIVTKEIN